MCSAIAKDLYHCDEMLSYTLENDYLFTKEEAFITGVSTVVGAAEEALLLWWTQFKCTEMHITQLCMGVLFDVVRSINVLST